MLEKFNEMIPTEWGWGGLSVRVGLGVNGVTKNLEFQANSIT